MPQPVSTTALRLHSFRALQPGPRLIVTGAVHGNEVCGSQAIERVAREFDSGALELQRGSLTLLPVTNPLAYERGQRNGDRNLNRNLYPNAEPQDYEDRIANLLCPLLADRSQNSADIASQVADALGRPLGAPTALTGMAVSFLCPKAIDRIAEGGPLLPLFG